MFVDQNEKTSENINNLIKLNEEAYDILIREQ